MTPSIFLFFHIKRNLDFSIFSKPLKIHLFGLLEITVFLRALVKTSSFMT